MEPLGERVRSPIPRGDAGRIGAARRSAQLWACGARAELRLSRDGQRARLTRRLLRWSIPKGHEWPLWPCGALALRFAAYIPLNNPVKLRLTSSFSGCPFTATSWRPRRSRLTPAMNLVLTSVER